MYDKYPDLTVCWMIRSWDPKVWTRPVIPVRVPYSPASIETPTNPPVDEPSIDPSVPAQEPPDEPEVPVDQPSGPQETAEEGPEDDEMGEETPEDEEPADEAPSEPEDPPEADEPGEVEDKGQEPTPNPSPETGVPVPHIGRGFVFWRIVEWILDLWDKIKIGKR